MEKISVFLDYANINSGTFSQNGFDYGALLGYLAEGRSLVEAYAYVPIDPRNEHGRDFVMERLWTDGFIVSSKVGSIVGDGYKCDFDVEMTMDLMRVAHAARPDIVVLCSGDGDFLPVVHELRRTGIRVEIASWVRSASRRLTTQASSFINLDNWLADQETREKPEGLENHLDETPLSFAADEPAPSTTPAHAPDCEASCPHPGCMTS